MLAPRRVMAGNSFGQNAFGGMADVGTPTSELLEGRVANEK
ncbi:hypothetical protein Pan216_32230 [Planctomycetes bacterium Pan216]|uniref:Uncharacterized protein n=1 Tax=Kolteria novifilia TaxID=2527975 RepID=A0A518B5W8_9BACT|nr:hypothetical protein Pan216_32230 [Planctomycetes bacterium Pan216]